MNFTGVLEDIVDIETALESLGIEISIIWYEFKYVL